jgi:acyl-CoA thioesterase
MSDEAFFTQNGDIFTPARVSAGPWDPNSLHGRVVVGLLGHEIQRRHSDDTFMPARLTVDMYRLPGFDTVEVTTRMVRDGKRIKVVDAEFISGGVSMARATCQLLKRTQNPDGAIWSPPNWNVPPPEKIELPDDLRKALGGMWEIRPIEGKMGTIGRRQTWMREVRDLIAGVPLTPFARAALAADFASPFANAGANGLAYINSDVTLYLHRLPVDEWIGFEVVNHQATDGVAIGECFAYDRNGAIGSSSVTALAQRAMKLG